MIAEAVYARDSLSTAVRSFGAALATGRTVDDVEAWPERIGAVTAAEVNAAAAYVLDPGRSVTGRLQPGAARHGDRRARRRARPRRRSARRRSMPASGRRWLAAAIGAGLLSLSVAVAALRPAPDAEAAAKVERVVSPGGIEAYLLSEPSIPFLSLSLQFRGGAALDPAGKEGLAYMVSGLLDEGAGDLDSQAFRTELEDLAIRLSFDAGRDEFTGQLKTLTEHRARAFELLRSGADRAALRCRAGRADPQPDPGRTCASARRTPTTREPRPGSRPPSRTTPMAARPRARAPAWRRSRRRTSGPSSRSRLARDNLVIGVAGDITAAELGRCWIATFGELPARSAPIELAPGPTREHRHRGRAQGRAPEPGFVRRGRPRPRRSRLLRRLRRQPPARAAAASPRA